MPSPDAGVTGDAVWAIDEAHLPNYLLPRDCPRVTYAAGPGTTAGDVARFFDNTGARRVIVIEQSWLERLACATIFVYEMPPATFRPADASAGYYVSRSSVRSLGVRALRDPMREIIDRGCEVRAVPDLLPIRDGVTASTLDYSIIRMRNVGRRRQARQRR